MITGLSTLQLASIFFGGGFVFGFLAGAATVFILTRPQIQYAKILTILVFFVWLAFHTLAFFTDLQVATIFDFVGFGAAGNLMGLDVAEIVKSVKKKSN